jgi:hypothetical protein
MIVIDKNISLVLTGNGDVLEPEDGIMSIGSGGGYALAAARALVDIDTMDAEHIARRAIEIAGDICIYTNKNIISSFCPMSSKPYPANQVKEVQYRIVKENIDYFEKMCQSKFVLCPAGDAPWSFRFYEVLMCKSIPIVESWHHTYRTKEEAQINYKYIIFTDINEKINYDDYLNENTIIFENSQEQIKIFMESVIHHKPV